MSKRMYYEDIYSIGLLYVFLFGNHDRSSQMDNALDCLGLIKIDNKIKPKTPKVKLNGDSNIKKTDRPINKQKCKSLGSNFI